MADKFELDGYLFLNKADFDKAKKEQEAIEYIRSHTDWNNGLMVHKMYQKLLEKGTFQTIIGYEFLKSLQNIIIKGNEIPKKNINPIPVKLLGGKQEVKSFQEAENEKKITRYQELYEKEKSRKISLKIVIGFLAAIIIGMLVISRLTPYSVFTNYEEKIVNQYVEWQTQLEEKEAQLKEREQKLKEKEQEME